MGGSAVLGAQAQNARDENLEGAIGCFGDERDHRGLPFWRFPAQNAHSCVNVAIFHGASSDHLCFMLPSDGLGNYRNVIVA